MTISATANGRDRATTSSFLRRVRIRNYKSIAYCDVELGPLTILVGRNGSGKSNFLEALQFFRDAFTLPLSILLTLRGRVAPLRKDLNVPCELEIEMELGDGKRATYGVVFTESGLDVAPLSSETLEIRGADDKVAAYFHVKDSLLIESSVNHAPPMTMGHPYLANVAGFPEFRAFFDAIIGLEVYQLNPESMRPFQPSDGRKILSPSGENIAGVVRRIESEQPGLMERIKGYLASIVPGIDVKSASVGPVDTLEFRQTTPDSDLAPPLYPINMSDGTLRTLGTLVAVAQLAMKPPFVRLVGIEEPETALHPAAAAALMGAMQEASVSGQVIVTTHSPDLLDRVDFDSDRVLVVEMRDGETVIGSINKASLEAIKEHLFSPGELLRMDQLQPDWRDLERQMVDMKVAGPAE
jgi:predicted ATPase